MFWSTAFLHALLLWSKLIVVLGHGHNITLRSTFTKHLTASTYYYMGIIHAYIRVLIINVLVQHIQDNAVVKHQRT